MRRALAWAALAVFAGCAIYGLFHERLFDQALWSSQGLDRLIGFCRGVLGYLGCDPLAAAGMARRGGHGLGFDL